MHGPHLKRKRQFGCLVFSVLIAIVAALGVIEPVDGREIGPDDSLCSIINEPETGSEVILRPGEYRGPCVIRRGGAADRPLVIRARDPGERPRIRYDGSSANVIEVRADHVVIMGLAFGPTQRNVDGVRIRASRNVSILDCEFSHMGGIAVVANQSSLQGLRVSRNLINLSQATAMYFGCHDGDACRLTDVVIEKNRIDGVTAEENGVGYGIQVKLNSAAIVRDNVVKNTKGPGIMIYGARDLSMESLIERNFISGSTSSGIVVGGGPALVRNNIAVGNALGGIWLHDYAQRDLLHEIKVGFNTLLDNGKGAIIAAQGKLSETMLVGNVGSSGAAGSPFPPRQAGLTNVDNMACERTCFADSINLDLSPARNSMLARRVVSMKAAWIPQDDFFGQRRGGPPKIGAVETPGHTLAAGAVQTH